MEGWQPQGIARPNWLSESYLDAHAPFDWRTRYRTDDPWRAIQTAGCRPWAVVSLDIRKSTSVRRALDEPFIFEGLMENYFVGSKLDLRQAGFWFDKFLGDGFLAFAPIWGDEGFGAVRLDRFLLHLGRLLSLFESTSGQVLREVLGDRLPREVGAAIGVDAGQCRLWPMDNQPEFQGEPVIVATRMQSVAEAGEIVVAPHLGATIEHDLPASLPRGMSLETDRRVPKDHPEGVAVRVLRYHEKPIIVDGIVKGWSPS